jgi:hypothetical protein
MPSFMPLPKAILRSKLIDGMLLFFSSNLLMPSCKSDQQSQIILKQF